MYTVIKRGGALLLLLQGTAWASEGQTSRSPEALETEVLSSSGETYGSTSQPPSERSSGDREIEQKLLDHTSELPPPLIRSREKKSFAAQDSVIARLIQEVSSSNSDSYRIGVPFGAETYIILNPRSTQEIIGHLSRLYAISGLPRLAQDRSAVVGQTEYWKKQTVSALWAQSFLQLILSDADALGDPSAPMAEIRSKAAGAAFANSVLSILLHQMLRGPFATIPARQRRKHALMLAQRNNKTNPGAGPQTNYRLEGITNKNGTFQALINGAVYNVGDSIDQYKITEITLRSSTLQDSSTLETRRLEFDQ